MDKLTSASTKRQVSKLIDKISSLDSLAGVSNLKKLKGHKNAYRVRLGDYWIGLLLDGNTVTFARLLHRKDIYNIFP